MSLARLFFLRPRSTAVQAVRPGHRRYAPRLEPTQVRPGAAGSPYGDPTRQPIARAYPRGGYDRQDSATIGQIVIGTLNSEPLGTVTLNIETATGHLGPWARRRSCLHKGAAMGYAPSEFELIWREGVFRPGHSVVAVTVGMKVTGNPRKVPGARPRDNTSDPFLAAVGLVLRAQARSGKTRSPELPVKTASVAENKRAAPLVDRNDPNFARVMAFLQDVGELRARIAILPMLTEQHATILASPLTNGTSDPHKVVLGPVGLGLLPFARLPWHQLQVGINEPRYGLFEDGQLGWIMFEEGLKFFLVVLWPGFDGVLVGSIVAFVPVSLPSKDRLLLG